MNRFIFTPLTLEQKIKFFKYALQELNNNDSPFGFCVLFNEHFGYNTHSLKELPELLKYKPRKRFYDYKNEETDEDTQFWFPVGFPYKTNDEKRIKICEKILEKLIKE